MNYEQQHRRKRHPEADRLHQVPSEHVSHILFGPLLDLGYHHHKKRRQHRDNQSGVQRLRLDLHRSRSGLQPSDGIVHHAVHLLQQAAHQATDEAELVVQLQQNAARERTISGINQSYLH